MTKNILFTISAKIKSEHYVCMPQCEADVEKDFLFYAQFQHVCLSAASRASR